MAVPVATTCNVPRDSLRLVSALPVSKACGLTRQTGLMVSPAKLSQVTAGISVTVTLIGSLTQTPCALVNTNCVTPGATPTTPNDVVCGPPVAKFSVRLPPVASCGTATAGSRLRTVTDAALVRLSATGTVTVTVALDCPRGMTTSGGEAL